MPTPVSERSRKIDLASLSTEEQDQLAKRVADFVSKKMGETSEEIKKVLNVYGLDFHILWEMCPEDAPPMWKKPDWYRSMANSMYPKSKTTQKTGGKKKAARKKISKGGKMNPQEK